MKQLMTVLGMAVLLALPATAPAKDPPPNWKGSAAGTTDHAGAVDVEAFAGKSTHLGKFTGEGSHVLFPDFSFVGRATWTAANGDQMFVTYAGQLFPGTDPDFPFAFEAVLIADGGTGRLAGAQGRAVMTGAFTGTFPGELYFDFEGTLSVNGK
jgi:hypothetical protein